MNKLVATFKKIAAAVVAFGTAALCATTVHAGGFDGKPLATNDWFDVGFSGVAANTSIATGGTTGITRGAGSWTAPTSGDAIVQSDGTLKIDTDGNDPLTLTPAALPNTVSNETISVEVLATPSTDELEAPTDSPISAFALRADGSTITPVAYVAGGWTNLVYANAADLTNDWFTFYTDFATVGDTKYLRFSVQPDGGTRTVLVDSQGNEWFPAANGATKISSVSLSGSTSCRTISGDSLFDAVASVNGTNYATFAEAITAAGETYDIIVLDNAAAVPAGWKIADGKLVEIVYVAQIFGGNQYETIQEAINAASAGDTINILISHTVDSEIEVNKAVTISGQSMDGTILNSTINKTASSAFKVTANNVTIENLTINRPASVGNSRPYHINIGPSATVSNITVQNVKFTGGHYCLNLYASDFTIDSCVFENPGSDAILLGCSAGDSQITNNEFVQTSPSGQGFIYCTNGRNYSSGTLTISGNVATKGRCLFHFLNWANIQESNKVTLNIVNNVATNYNNKGIVFASGSGYALGSLFNSITITNNVLFTSAKRPTIQRDDSDTSLPIDASYNYWGVSNPNFDEIIPDSDNKYYIVGNNIVHEPYYSTYDPAGTPAPALSDLRPLPSPVVTFLLRDEVGDMTIQYDSSVYTIHTQDGVERSGAAVYNYMTQTVANGGLATEPAGEPSYWYHSGKTFPVGNNTGIPFTVDDSRAYVFDGWRLSGASERYDFSTPVTSDITLVPHFSALEAVFEIYTEADLFAFAREVALGRSYRSKWGGDPRQTVKLMNNITLTSNWTPIPGNFHGIFDGNGYAISGLVINDTTNEETGFFRTSGKSGNSFVVTDLTFQNPSVTSTGSFVGVLVGQADCVTVTNVTVNNPTVLSTSADNVGGLVGSVNNNVTSSDAVSTFSGCSVNGGTISCTGSDGRMVGGLIGQGLRYLTVTNCSVSNVTINGYRKLGGLIGQANEAHLTCTDASVSGVTLNALGTTSYAKDLTLGGFVGLFANSQQSTFTGTVSDLTMTGPESIASGKNYVMGWVSGGTGGTVEAAETAMSGASMTFDVTVSGTNTRTVPNDSTYAGINGMVVKVGYSEYETPTFVFGEGEDPHELTATEANYLNSIIASNGCTKTELETALAGMTVEEFKDAALLNIDITEMSSQTYAKPDFNITAIKRFRDNGQQKVKVTVKLDRHGSEVSQPINGVLQLKTSPDGKDGNWRVLSEVEISDDNFSEGSESDFILSAEGADHIFKATVVERPSASNN